MLPTVDNALDEQGKLRAHREAVLAVENEMRKIEPRTIEVKHHFAHGVYAREVFLPKGTLATGKIHKYTQVNIVSQGDISVLTENGEIRLTAPATVISPPGTKRLVYAHEDTVWTTILGSHETDVAKLEAELVVDTEEEYQQHVELLHGKLLEIA